ncbi:YebC/PmpR family DNA-binding transcriptional regulator [Candidatus Saccharibacteria bacterium]|jgi:YebC/PmpR family DNA-binding regulatory protein|nr:YebC/PmpR family DNA-binding transcriptional regulator [Candidatus Saccharibacteria bacterium]
MSGHSKWAKIKRGKESEDAKRGAIFTKLGNAIALAAKTGGDPNMNPTLALAVQKAKEANMPNANIERSIKRGTGELGGAIIEEMTYEGYGPGGVAIIVECASDNRNRTYADVRTAFSKHGGNIAETGAVSFQFEHKGVVELAKSGDDDADQLAVIDAGADDVIDGEDHWIVYTDMKQLHQVKKGLESAELKVKQAHLAYVPKEPMEIDDESTQNKIMRLLDILDELDDVVETYTNFDIA